MKNLKSPTKRLLAIAGLVAFVFLVSIGVWFETRGVKTDPSPACSNLDYAEQATHPGQCQ
ncbi:MAG TPA: hypothetical protein VK694_08065 [Verrucomicrobiae bacterium]|nr:hypothetical protein [Verrucomicrobiae bacterium]